MKFSQLPHTLLMIKPAAFGSNAETASSNAFQAPLTGFEADIQGKALAEFNRMTDLLSSHEIDVRVFDDTGGDKPDSIFPNNWISFHEDGTVVLYPMMAPSRRRERRPDIMEKITRDFKVSQVIDFTPEELNGKFLEGTGSLVFDHPNKMVYACHSPRTHPELVQQLSTRLGYNPIMFDAVDEAGKPIYHTNVLMSVGKKFALICLDAIKKETDQDIVLDNLAGTDHKIIAISYAQMRAFAGNVLEVQNRDGDPIVLMSETAFQSFLPGQINAISEFADILPIKIDAIEKYGGGSVRCMVAGIHLPK
jgi:hypothetical protein